MPTSELQEAMTAGGAHLDASYVCMHHPTLGEPPYRKDCDCRKPRPGMLRRAEAELGADLSRSWVVGDRRSDLQVAWSVGARGALVAGRGARQFDEVSSARGGRFERGRALLSLRRAHALPSVPARGPLERPTAAGLWSPTGGYFTPKR